MSDPQKSEATHEEKLEKLRELIKEIDFAMLTTQDADGHFRSCPMSTNGDVEFDGDVWFFTCGNSTKVQEIEKQPHVNVSYSHPKDQSYVSLSGNAEVVREQSKVEELWKPELKAWFPDGPETKDIALLKINVEKAEYWDTPGSAVAHAIGFAKAIVTRQTPDVGENEKLDLK